MTFHNTTNEVGKELRKRTEKAFSQKEMVLALFTLRSKKPMAWTEVSSYLPDINEVSLKRCMSDLKNEGKLTKTTVKSISKYGKGSYQYKLKTK